MIGTLKNLDLLVRFGGQEPGFSVPDRGSRATWADHQQKQQFLIDFWKVLGAKLGPCWEPKFYFFRQDPLQEVFKSAPGAF